MKKHIIIPENCNDCPLVYDNIDCKFYKYKDCDEHGVNVGEDYTEYERKHPNCKVERIIIEVGE